MQGTVMAVAAGLEDALPPDDWTWVDVGEPIDEELEEYLRPPKGKQWEKMVTMAVRVASVMVVTGEVVWWFPPFRDDGVSGAAWRP